MDPHNFIARAEAQRWIGIAEKLLVSQDLVGSKTFAIRARESDPRLEAADQILAIADTLIAAEKRVVGNNGSQQPDFYAILQVGRFVQDTEHIAAQYRRLAVTLNPHQNRFPFSDQAFQLVNDAWAVLSNPMRKSMYDADLEFQPQQQMNSLGFNLEQQHHHQQHHQQQHQHNFFSINHMGTGHEREMSEPSQTFQTRVQQSHQQQQLQQHNFLSQPNPIRPVPVREQEQLFQQREQEQLFQQREQEQLFQPQVKPFQITSPRQQTRPPPQPPQPQPPMQPTPPPPPAAPPQSPLPWSQTPPLSQPKPEPQQQQQQPFQLQPKPEPQHHQPFQLQPEPQQPQIFQPQPQQHQPFQPQPPKPQQQQPLQAMPQQKQPLQSQPPQQQPLQPQQQKQQPLQPQPQKQQPLQPEPQKQQPLQPEPQKQQPLQPQPQSQQPLQPQPQKQEALQPQLQQQQPLQSQPQPQPQPQQFLQQQLQQQQSVEQNASSVQLPTEFTSDNGVREEEMETEIETETETETETEEAAEDVADSPTFWTACPYCFYMYEYPRIYAECTIRCDNCKRAFQSIPIPSPPPTSEGQEAYFCCWGFFPLGVSMSHMEKNNGTRTKPKWTPFSPLYDASSNGENHLNGRAAPKKNIFGNKNSGPHIYIDDVVDDVFVGISEPSDDSDDEWGTNTTQKKKRKRRTKTQVQVASERRTGSGSVTNLENGTALQEGIEVRAVPVTESGTKSVGGNPRRQSIRVKKELGKLDLNVEFNNNEGEEHAPGMAGGNRRHGQGEEDTIEGIGFFEGLDEFFSSLPILSVVNDEKVKA